MGWVDRVRILLIFAEVEAVEGATVRVSDGPTDEEA